MAKAPPSVVSKRRLLLAASFPIIAIGLLNGLWLDPLYRASPLAFWAADVGNFVVLPAIALAVLGLYGGIWPRDYGFRPMDLSPFAVAGVFAFITFLYWLFYNPIREIAFGFFSESEGYSYGRMLPQWGLYRLFALVYMSLTAAFVEEAVFRSIPWLYFSLRFPNRDFAGAYVVSTSILFAAIHWEQGPAGLIAAFTVGVIAAVMYSKLRYAWPFVFAHFVTDLGTFS